MTSALEAFYDSKFPNFEGLVKGSIGIDIKLNKLLIKVLPKFKHFIGTACGVSQKFCSVENEYLGGMGKGNGFSGKVCRYF